MANFLFSLLFGASKRWNLFWVPQRSVKINIYAIFISINFSMLINTLQFHLLNWQGLGPVWVISISVVYTRLLVWAFPQLLKLNLTYCLKSSLSLACCFLFVYLIDQTQIYPLSIWLLALFQGIICNIEILKREPWSPESLGGPKLKGRVLKVLFILWLLGLVIFAANPSVHLFYTAVSLIPFMFALSMIVLVFTVILYSRLLFFNVFAGRVAYDPCSKLNHVPIIEGQELYLSLIRPVIINFWSKAISC